MSCSGIVTGIYTTSSPEACQYIAHDCRANIIVVDTQKQLEKILKVWEKGQWSRGSELTKDSPPSLPESPSSSTATVLTTHTQRARQGSGHRPSARPEN